METITEFTSLDDIVPGLISWKIGRHWIAQIPYSGEGVFRDSRRFSSEDEAINPKVNTWFSNFPQYSRNLLNYISVSMKAELLSFSCIYGEWDFEQHDPIPWVYFQKKGPIISSIEIASGIDSIDLLLARRGSRYGRFYGYALFEQKLWGIVPKRFFVELYPSDTHTLDAWIIAPMLA
jgi:hypothetical protein